MFNLALLLQQKINTRRLQTAGAATSTSDGQSEWAARARRSLKFCEMQVNLIASA
jgi:hypothetical protein